jgi:hypothetical protein
MGSRWYDPQLGRWISPDPIVPNPGNPQSLNRYSYVYNRPLVYVDDSGHIPIIPIIVTIVVAGSKVVDYALTAYDAWQSGRVLADPNASRGDKLMAGLNVGLAAVFEALEPDDVLPVGLPADDVARRAVMTGAREAFEEGGEEALERFLRDTLGDQADDVIERMFREVGEEGAERAGQAYRFATGDKLMDHFRKHGAEFGYETAKQYLQGAQRLVSGEGIETFVRASGDTLFYDAATNEFAVLSKEGVIRTYFKPERGIEYWLTQIGGR